jgi:hypothetical protein
MEGEQIRPTVGRTDAQKVHARESAAQRLVEVAENEYLDMANELVDAKKMLAEAVGRAEYMDPMSEEGKKQAERVDQLSSLVAQMQLIIDDLAEVTNEKSKQYAALKDQMKRHLN